MNECCGREATYIYARLVAHCVTQVAKNKRQSERERASVVTLQRMRSLNLQLPCKNFMQLVSLLIVVVVVIICGVDSVFLSESFQMCSSNAEINA